MECCPYCGSENLFTVLCELPSIHHARTGCRDCGKHIRWEPKPMTPERAAAFEMPLGKHRGETLGTIAGSGSGRGYLDWLRAQDFCKGALRRAIDELLGPSPDAA